MAAGFNPIRVGDIYRLKISLREVRPLVWRRLEIGGSADLAELHDAIQLAFGWYDAHLHEFRIDGRNYGEPDPEWDREAPVQDERKAHLALVAPPVGGRFLYLYDFGDGWEHDIVVEAIEPSGPRVRYPRLLAGARAGPPEDVGGPPGYVDLLKAIRDPRRPDHEEMLEWVGGDFDPDAFDPRDVNDAFDMLDELAAERRWARKRKRQPTRK